MSCFLAAILMARMVPDFFYRTAITVVFLDVSYLCLILVTNRLKLLQINFFRNLFTLGSRHVKDDLTANFVAQVCFTSANI